MSMLTLQVLALLLLFGLIGAFLGWLIRPLFCKPIAMVGRANLSGSAGANANAKMGTSNTSVKGKASGNKTSGNKKGSGGKTAAAAVGIAAAAATAAAVSSSNKKADGAKAKAETDKTAQKSKADQAAKQASIEADKKRLAADAARNAEKDKADKAAAAKAEADRIAAEKSKAARIAEEQRIAAEKAKAAKLADEQRIASEKDKANQAARTAAIEADKKKLAAEAEAARKVEADRIAAEKAKADQAAKDAAAKTEVDRVAAEKAKADQAAKDAKAKTEADSVAAEKAKADQAAKDAKAKAEADRIAAEQKAKADQAAKDTAAKAEADRIAAEQKAKADQAAKDAAAKAKADQAAKDAAAKAEADRVALEQKAKADQAAKDAAARADQAAKDAATKAATDKAAAEKANTAKLAAAATAAAVIASSSGVNAEDDLASVTDDMRPDRLSAPRGGKADDLKRIKGIGPVIEGTLNEEGVYHFQQVADFSPDNVKWVDKNVSIPGRVKRDDWIGQAKSLVDGKEYDGYAKDIAGTDDPSLPAVTEDMRPAKLSGPSGGKADDLKRINGIGPVIEKTLNSEGIYHFKQIADFTPDNVNWVDKHISFPGRITREEWIRQAKGLDAEKGAGSSADGSGAAREIVVTEDMRPTRRSLSAGQKGDDLKVINGIGPVIEDKLNGEGVHFYQQIADFDDDNTKWVDNHMAFPGRIHREDWIGQAKVLVGQKGAGGSDSGGVAAQAETVTENMRPTRRNLSAGEKGDDLKVINGIGPVIEDKLNNEGIYFYQQVADFNGDNTKWVDNHMAFPGRIHREDWIGQAKVLVGQKGAGSSGSEIAVTEDMRPTRRDLSAGEKGDDLKVINGIGPVIEDKLNNEGIYFYQQVADFDDDNTKWVDNHMAFPGRIHREDWIGQAKVLVGQKGADTSGSGSTGSSSGGSALSGTSSNAGNSGAGTAAAAVGSGLGSTGAVPDSMKPSLLTAPEGGKADDLKRIKGIGKVLQKNLHEMGIYHYEQLAALTPDNIAWLTDYVSFPEGRIDDEKWVSQAKALAEGKQTEYSQRFDKGDTPYK